jgi:general stress protein YciG
MTVIRPISRQSPVSPIAEATDKASQPAARVSRKSQRGFASMDPAQQRLIASEGGKASNNSGRAHRWTAAEASAAGRKGGLISRRTPNPKPAAK